MYDPVKDGVAKTAEFVVYNEVPPPAALAELVHCFWELRTEVELASNFTLHAMPDACVNLLFNQLDPRIAGVTQLQTTHTTLDLGRSFHYVGEPYEGELPLVDTATAAAPFDFEGKSVIMADLVETLLNAGLVAPNAVTASILTNLDRIYSVGDMAEAAAVSPRQLQRVLKSTTGFTPHDLLKVLRIQHSFRRDYLLLFADQAHFTHSFRRLTGYTPGEFRKTFDV